MYKDSENSSGIGPMGQDRLVQVEIGLVDLTLWPYGQNRQIINILKQSRLVVQSNIAQVLDHDNLDVKHTIIKRWIHNSACSCNSSGETRHSMINDLGSLDRMIYINI